MTDHGSTAIKNQGGRPAEYQDRITTTLRIERELLARADAEAAKRDLSRNKVLNLAIERGLALLAAIPGENGRKEAP